MITSQGLENLKEEIMGTLEEYTESFYRYLNVELNAESRAGLKPLIAQAHDKGISTLDLIEIVKSGIKK